MHELLAGRFARVAGADWIDVATGVPVCVSRHLLDMDTRRRQGRSCEAEMQMWHPGIVPLIDFGALANGDWFEARARVARPRRRCDGHRTPRRAPVEPALRIALCRRPLTDRLLDLLEGLHRPGARVYAIDAPPRIGLTTWWRTTARELRLHGYTAVHASLVDWWLSIDRGSGDGSVVAPIVVWHERPVWDERDRQSLASTVIRIAARKTTSTVVLDVVRQGRPGPTNLSLSEIDTSALVAAVQPSPVNIPPALLMAAARDAGGYPGLFVRALGALSHAGGANPQPLAVHEDPSAFESTLDEAGDASAVAHAERLARGGRWSAGLRHLRRRTGACTRRGRASAAVRFAAEEIRLAERGGSPLAMRRAWQNAFSTLSKCHPAVETVSLSIALGRAWTLDARLAAAEGLFGGAISSAEVRGDRSGAARAREGLAECLCWQARWHDAAAVIADVSSPEAARLRVWIHLRRGDLQAAVQAAASLDDTSDDAGERDGAVALMAAVSCDAAISARDRARAGAEALMARVATAGVLVRTEAGVWSLEALVKAGVRSFPPSVTRAARLATARGWPRLLRCRARLALTLTERPSGSARLRLADQVRRFALDSGATALCLDTGIPWPWPESPNTPMLNDLVHVLEACQQTDTPGDALTRVSRLVRERVRAASVVVLGVANEDDLRPLATSGPEPPVLLARRALDRRLAVAPEVTDRGPALACPVNYGRHVLGVIGCRWAVADRPPDDAVALVETVATAVAPTVRLAIDVLVTPPSPPSGGTDDLIGESEAMRLVRRQVEAAAQAPFPVLVEGESGSGKEVVARSIHRGGPRRLRAFCALNCAALGDDLVEAELFGHARGAFTGAVAERAGLFEEAHGGTLFLDEVSELSARAQAKVLRALQEGEIRRLGESRSRQVDVRVIAATNRPLGALVEAGLFRVDLRYRLDVIRIEMPPLRSRPDDVPLLVRHYWRQAAARVGSRAGLSPDVCAALVRYAWPGNVRELQNVLACLAVTAPRAGRIGPAALPAPLQTTADVEALPLDEARRRFEVGYVRAALARAGGHRARAAAALGLTRQGLSKLMDRLGVAAGV